MGKSLFSDMFELLQTWKSRQTRAQRPKDDPINIYTAVHNMASRTCISLLVRTNKGTGRFYILFLSGSVHVDLSPLTTCALNVNMATRLITPLSLSN